MISRRNIRVKVMQTLYTLSNTQAGGQEEIDKKIGLHLLEDKLTKALDLFTTSVLYTIAVAEYSETDLQQRSSRYLVTAEDRNISTKIAGNLFLQQIRTDKAFIEKIDASKIERFIDQEWVKSIYQQLTKTPEYKVYISDDERVFEKEKAIMHFIWNKLMCDNESLQSHFVDELPGWEDDSEMIKMLMDNFFKSSAKANFQSLVSEEKKEFAKSLLTTVIEKKEYCMSMIHPKLNNWDTERVALIDLLLLRMGLCEFLYFPTIPTKVTINEYIEIAKMYSTPQSAQFVNGVLDNILKDLVKENKITKQERSSKS